MSSEDDEAPPPPATAAKSSSEILNELFSTFDASLLSTSKKPKKSKKEKKKKKKSSHDDTTDSEVDKKLLKKSSLKKKKLKLKHKLEEHTRKVKRKLNDEDDAGSSCNKNHEKKRTKKKLELEDGEILEDMEKRKTKSSSNKKRRKEIDRELLEQPPRDSSIINDHHHEFKMSASQAFRLDEEERRGSNNKHNNSHNRSPPTRRSNESYSNSSSSSSSVGRRSRSRSPPPRIMAPPRDSYKRSYMKFKKQSDSYDDNISSSSSSSSSRSSYSSSADRYSSYDTEKYYDYHSKRSRTDYSSSKCGFGYVSKSYYYDDVEDSSRDRDHHHHHRQHHHHHSSSSGGGGSSRSREDRSRERDRYGTSAWRHRERSKSPLRRSYYHPDDIIDKSELLEIARKNAKKLMQRGVLPSDIFSRDQILALKAGGKSVEELTQYCKRLAKRDAAGDARDRSDDDDDDDDSDDDNKRFVHHPFQVKDRPLPTITLNIRNSVPLPVRTPQELAIESAKLRTQFPVSSGTQHRFKELEWKPVDDDNNKKENEEEEQCKALVSLDSLQVKSDDVDSPTATAADAPAPPNDSCSSSEMKAIEAPAEKEDTGISVDGPDLPAVDISSVIGLRLKAMRTLQENPMSEDAKKQLQEATKMMKDWADAKALEPKFLTPAELQSGPQAWAKRDQLRKTKALDSGMGMHLLQKMGWRPGEGLGKNKEGSLEPLALDVKTDKKGLTAAVEELMYGKRGGSGATGPSMPVVYDLSGKHPVSALMELTAKRRWGNPEFELCFEHGPSHKKQFVYKVVVNGVEYQPCVAVGNKKQAKANAAAFCLQSLGLLPTAQVGGTPTEMLQTVGEGATASTPVPPPPPHLLQSPTTIQQSGANPLQKQFSASELLRTVNVTTVCNDDNSDPKVLMPPPPPPPPLLK